jgi:hypothetical protein
MGTSRGILNMINRWLGIVLCLVLVFSAAAGSATVSVRADDSSSQPAEINQYEADADWTFMVYLDGDNNLESSAIGDFLEMASVGSSANINIVAQFDRIPGYDSSYGNWTDCKRFYITSGLTPDAANAVQDLGEVNMGDPSTLIDFVNWAKTDYPAQNYAVVLWNHGGGWRAAELAGKEETQAEGLAATSKEDLIFKAVCWDDTSGGDSLYMSEVQSALATTGGANLIGFDACLMGMVEVAYEIRSYGAVMVGSEEVEPGSGWPYNTVLADLTANPGWTPAQLGTCIVDRYYESIGNGIWDTQAASNLATMNTLAATISSFAQTMIDDHTNQTAVKNAAQSVMNQISSTVIAEHHGSSQPGSHGLAIYFPATPGSFNSDYNGTIIDFPGDTLWEEFLADYYASMAGSWIQYVRTVSQEYDYPEHIDLYDFCQKLVDYIPCSYNYTEYLLAHEFIGGGTAQGWNDDDKSWLYTLPFSFPFYGNTYSQVYVCSNGFLDFTSAVPSWNNSNSELMTRVMVAPLWDDLRTDGTAQSNEDIYIHQPTPDSVCIRWRAERYASSDPVNVEAILYSDGTIKFNYGDGNTHLSPTIGISNGNYPCFQLASYNGDSALTNVDSVELVTLELQKLIGSDTPGNANTGANRLILGKFQATETGNITQVRVYSRASGNVKVAVYEDNAGKPGDLLSANNTPAPVTAGRWNIISLPSTAVTLNSYYWLAVANNVAGATSYSAAGTGTSKGKAITFSTFHFAANPKGLTNYTYDRAVAGWGEPTLGVTTNAATAVGDGTATLNGSLTGLDSDTSAVVQFEYGSDTSYGDTITAVESPMSSLGSFSVNLSSLTNGQEYHFRATATGDPSNDTVYGDDMTFTPNAPPVKLIGSDTPGNANTGAGRLILGKFQATQTGHITQMRVYSRAGGKVKVAVFADNAGKPGDLLGANNTPTPVTAGRWNIISLPSTAVTLNSYYWLAVANNVAGATSYSAAGTGTSKGKAITFSTFHFAANPTGFTNYTYDRAFAGWGTPDGTSFDASTYTNTEYCFSLKYPSNWVERPELVTTPLHLAAFGVPAFVPILVIAALDADAPMSKGWIVTSFQQMGYINPVVVSPLTETILADGTVATTYKINFITVTGYEATAFCLDADRCDKRIHIMVFTIDAFEPYNEALYSEIAHTLFFTCTCE